MIKLCGGFQACARLMALALMVVLSAVVAMAGDRVTLKDGRVIDGELVRELDGYVWIKHSVAGVEKTDFFGPTEIEKLERDAGAAPIGDAPVASEVPPPPARPGVPKAVIITLGDEVNGDMVGVYMTADQLKKAIPYLEQELGTDKTGIVVFRIHSGGGLALEVQRLSDVIQNEYKPRFRTVAWIDTAISAAAMTAHCLEEIYFTSQGNYGACTMFSGALVAAKDRKLEDALVMMERISARGGYDPLIMRAMQIQQPVSATIDADGVVHFYGDTTSGEFIVNRENEILTFNANTAAKCKFSRGTADSLNELTKLMGYQEIQWLGNDVKGVAWPVSRVEKMQMDFRKRVADDEKRTNEFIANYNMQVQAAASEPRETRAKFVGRARNTLDTIQSMVKNNPNFSFMAFGMSEEEFEEFIEQQEKILRDLLR